MGREKQKAWERKRSAMSCQWLDNFLKESVNQGNITQDSSEDSHAVVVIIDSKESGRCSHETADHTLLSCSQANEISGKLY